MGTPKHAEGAHLTKNTPPEKGLSAGPIIVACEQKEEGSGTAGREWTSQISCGGLLKAWI